MNFASGLIKKLQQGLQKKLRKLLLKSGINKVKGGLSLCEKDKIIKIE